MCQCINSCIYYNQTAVNCDYYEKEIKNISTKELKKCKHFKNKKQILENHRKYFQIDY
jgi:hypothetical protein